MLELLDAIRVLALREAWAASHDPVDPKSPRHSPEYEIRRIFRAYSKRFHTPLHAVYELPLSFVLEHYFEDVYEDMAARDDAESDAAWQKEIDLVTEEPEERRERVVRELADRRVGDKFHEDVSKQAQEDFLRDRQSKGTDKKDDGKSLGGARQAAEDEIRLPGVTRGAEIGPKSIKMRFGP